MNSVVAEEQVLAQAYAEVEKRFSGIDDLAHGWEHVSRVYKLAQYIAAQEGADSFIVGMAALMHDLGRTSTQHDNDSHHADLSVEMARELLQSYHVPADKQAAILHAIVAHSFSRGVEPQTLEACVVRDADRLDGLGAVGVMRWAITGAVRRTKDTLSYHPEDPFGEQHDLDDHIYMLDHFYLKLLKLGKTMATETGRLEAQRRTNFMHGYLDELKHEIVIG
jgi:uncharacterized protein